ncbi:MAG: hypothetical protein ABIT08_15540 [Bacteroidia bacterium]
MEISKATFHPVVCKTEQTINALILKVSKQRAQNKILLAQALLPNILYK